jgi:acetyl esterase/lipase
MNKRHAFLWDWVIAGLLCSVLAACSPAGILNATVPDDGATVLHDIAYEPGPAHRLDVYRPRQASGPLVVFLYGGSWRMGDKSMYPFVALPLAARGAVVVVPNYRLYPEVAFPEFVADNAAAVKWALEHAAALGADPRRVFVVGHSAGAYNAAMLALDPHYLAQAGTSRDRLAGVVGLAGPYNFLPITDPEVIPVFASVQDGPASQPITYVDGHNPPMLLLAGEDDTIVNPANTTSLGARIRSEGGPVETKLYPNLGHIGLITAFAPLFQRRAPVLDDVWRFIAAHHLP